MPDNCIKIFEAFFQLTSLRFQITSKSTPINVEPLRAHQNNILQTRQFNRYINCLSAVFAPLSVKK